MFLQNSTLWLNMVNEISLSSDIYIHTMKEKLYIYKFILEFVIYFIVLSLWKKYNNDPYWFLLG